MARKRGRKSTRTGPVANAIRVALRAVIAAKDKAVGLQWSRLHRVESELTLAAGKKRPRVDAYVRRDAARRQSREKRKAPV